MKNAPFVAIRDEEQLSQELAQLQQSAAVVSDSIRNSNQIFYRHLAELYMWWRGARELEGYLAEQYKNTGKKFKAKVSHGINFAPLFWLTWGYNNGLTDDKTGRWSRVLNKLHEQYETQAQYRTDSVPKLQNYITQSGGVDGLVGYGALVDDGLGVDDDSGLSDDDADLVVADEPPKMSMDDKLALLFDKAKSYYSALSNPPTINIDATLPLNADGLSMVLVRKVGDSYQLVGAIAADEMIRPTAMDTYLRDFAALPQSTRVLIETLSTQCLPTHLQRFYSSLVDESALMGQDRVRLKSIRRLMYRHSSDEFILSPVRANSGVVTVAKASKPVLAAVTQDVFLSTRSRRVLEERLVSGRCFNFYEPSAADVVPVYPHANLASHALRLQTVYSPSTFLHLDFWPFYETLPPPRGQVVPAIDDAEFGAWRAKLSLAWFRTFAAEFIAPWLATHANHIKRDHQKVFELVFAKTGLTVRFVRRDGRFENELKVGFGKTVVPDLALTVRVLTKDFAVAMQAIADLGVVSPVLVGVDLDCLAMRFSTTAADYRIYIPTCTLDGLRSGKHFTTYEPPPLVLDEMETYNDQAEGDFDPE